MQLESLKSSKFEELTEKQMKFIVGGIGNATMTGGSTGSSGTKYSNDFQMNSGGNPGVLTGGGDFTLRANGDGTSRLLEVNHVNVPTPRATQG